MQNGRMKILVSTSLLSPYRTDWLNELGKYADVKILCLHEDDREREKEWLAKRPKNCVCQSMKGKTIPKIGKISRDFIKELKRNGELYDVVILDGYGFATQVLNMRYLNRKKIPYFVNVDGIVPQDKKRGFVEKFKKQLLSKVPYFLCGSKPTNKILKGYGVKEERIFNHPFTSLFEADVEERAVRAEEKKALREKLGIIEEKVVISVGRFSYLNGYGKGYDAILRAAKKAGKDIGWYIVGGQPTEEFAKLTKDYGLTNVHYVDFKGKEELKEYYKASNLFVLMTVSDVWGLVVNEAMANGLPVITTDKCVAGLELIKEGENGHIIAVGDDEGLKERVTAFFADEKKAEEMSKNALETIRPYTIENMAKTHVEVFEKILKSEVSGFGKN